MSGRRLRRLCLVLALALISASCGGGDGSDDTTAAPATTAATTTAAPSSGGEATTTAAPATTTTEALPEDPGGPDDPPPADANKATVVVGDKTYEFSVDAHLVGKCDPNFFGAFWVIAASADGSGGNLEMFIVPEGNTNHDESSRVVVDAKQADERDWHANADGGQGAQPGTSSVDSFTIDGNTVSGTASFIDIYIGDDATAQGTFTATCAE